MVPRDPTQIAETTTAAKHRRPPACQNLEIRGRAEFLRTTAPLSDGSGNVSAIAMSFDAKRAASGHIDGTLRLWNISVDSWTSLACRLANRNMTDAEWKAHFRDAYRQTCPR
jgi:hypothetical protein